MIGLQSNGSESRTSRGFTLTEILVVISAIALLSSVVLASLSVARDRGRIGAGTLFEGNVYRSIGDTAVGRWTFDDLVENGVAQDTSPSNIGLPVAPGCVSPCHNVSSVTPNGTGKSFFIDTSVNTSVLRKQAPNPKLNITMGTIAAWIKAAPNQNSGNYGGSIIAAKSFSGYASYGLALYNGYLAIKNGDGSVPSNWIYNPSSQLLNDDKWHYVAMSFNGTVANGSHMYIDGKMIYTFTFTGMASGDGDLVVGSDPATYGAYIYLGYIDNLVIYNNVVTAEGIQRMYAEGLSEHPALSRI